MKMLGHNKGPTMEAGQSWRNHCWKRARADLMPHLPIEILRGRVKRAKELGLDYKTYASVRAATGHDVVGFLFSSNALRVFQNNAKLSQRRSEQLHAIQNCQRIALVTLPLTPEQLLAANPDSPLNAAAAPPVNAGWSATRTAIQAGLRPHRIAPDTVLLIGDTALEQEWSAAGKLAGYLTADRYFATLAP